MNRKKNIYRHFNRRNKFRSIKVITIILSFIFLGSYTYIKLKDVNIVSMLKNKIPVNLLLEKIPVWNDFESNVITSEDISKELDDIKDKTSEDGKKSEGSVEITEDIKSAKIEGYNIYTIQVASIQDNKEIEKIEDSLVENKIPFSIIEVDGLKKVHTYTFLDQDVTRSYLEEVRTVFPDAFLSQLKVPMLSIEYTDKYEYVGEISNQLNKLIKNFGDESSFWNENKESVDIKKYNEILTDRKEIIESMDVQVEKIDYSGMDIFKENLGTYIDDMSENIIQSSKSANEEKYYLSKSTFVSSMQGYFMFVNKIKGV